MQLGFSRENAFARELTATLAKELPPRVLEERRKVLSVNKITRQLERTFQRAADYQQQHRIGFIRRAMLANAFRWELREAGFPSDFVDMATEGLVVELSKARRPAGKPDA
jgi:hypothetical protein